MSSKKNKSIWFSESLGWNDGRVEGGKEKRIEGKVGKVPFIPCNLEASYQKLYTPLKNVLDFFCKTWHSIHARKSR